jgi:flavocytochrome c
MTDGGGIDRSLLVRTALLVVVLAFVGDLMLSRPKPRSHVIVVGGGLAGLTTAITAVSNGADVVLVEKTERIGGNSAKATSGINGWGTAAQLAAGVDNDSAEVFADDTLRSGIGGTSKPELVHALTGDSRAAIAWLADLGVPLTTLSQLGGHSRKRTHRAPDKADGTPTPIGFTIMQTLERHVRGELADRVTVMTSAVAQELLRDGERVVGVRVRQGGPSGDEVELRGNAVVLCTGGFSNDHTPTSLLAEYAPHLLDTPTTNGPFATGDGVKMARRVGAALIDMDKIQLHPTGFVNPKDPSGATKFLGPEALRGSGGVLLNAAGERFVDELELRSTVTAAIKEHGASYPGSNGCMFAHCVLNDAAADLFGRGALGFYWKKMGLFRRAETVGELADLLEVPEATVRGTLEAYEAAARSGKPCPLTGKRVFPAIIGADGPFYVAAVTPSIHYTMGGCEMTADGALINEATRDTIPGLYGAGEVTGGVHGGNRLGGNSLLECVVFGRRAGKAAAECD